MEEITRRTFNKSALIGAMALSFPCRSGGQSVYASKRPLVDPHAHTFNASDLPVTGFIRDVVLGGKWGPAGSVIGKLLDLIPSVSVKREKRKLEELLEADKGDFLVAPTREEVLREMEEEEKGRFAEGFNKAVEELRRDRAEDGEVMELLDTLEEGGFLKPEVYDTPRIDEYRFPMHDHGEGLVKDERKELVPVAVRTIAWIRLLVSWRLNVANKYLTHYGAGPTREGVHISASHLVDFSKWLDSEPDDNLADQVELSVLMSQVLYGRVHFFAPFCPLRDVIEKGGSFRFIQESVGKGCIGVKMYPPMGFRASGNSGRKFDEDFPTIQGLKGLTAAMQANLGERLDQRLDSLFEWCAEEGVPILAHCAPTNYAHEKYKECAHPKYWYPVLQKYPELRVCLGHYGGMTAAPAWAEDMASKMATGDFPNLFADLGHMEEILDDHERAHSFEVLNDHWKNHPAVRKQIMFATDWVMLERQPNAGDYIKFMEEGVQLTDQEANDFFALNSARYLGLLKGSKNRTRLKDLYLNQFKWSKNKLPSWMRHFK